MSPWQGLACHGMSWHVALAGLGMPWHVALAGLGMPSMACCFGWAWHVCEKGNVETLPEEAESRNR